MVTTTGPIPPLSGIAPIATAEVQPAASRLPLTEPEGPDIAELSRLGALLSRLTDLQRSDPAHAQRALLAMGSELSARAALEGGDAQLRALADAFTRAARTGDLSEVRPPGPPRPDELIESTAPNTATAQGQAASYALGEAPTRPDLTSLLQDALSRTELTQRSADRAERSADRVEQRRVEHAEAEQHSADRVEQRRVEHAEAEQHSADRVEQRRVEHAEAEQRRVEHAEAEQRGADRVEQRRVEQAELEQRRVEQAELEQRSADRVEQRRVEQAEAEQRSADRVEPLG